MSYKYTIHEKINFRSFATEITKHHASKLKEKFTNSLDKYLIVQPKGARKSDWNWLRMKDFISLPIGEFELTDKIYDFVMKKCKSDEGSIYYFLR